MASFVKQLAGLPEGAIVRIENTATGTVLDLDYGQSTDGTKVQGWRWLNRPNQKWKLLRVQ